MRLVAFFGLCVALGAVGIAAGAGGEVDAVDGGLVTLYHLDPISQTLNFETGNSGHVIVQNSVKNRRSDLDFGHYKANEFSVGIEGRRVGSIVDLGSPAELQARYGYDETVGGGQGFASIRLEEGELVILGNGRSRATQPMAGVEELLRDMKKQAHAPIHENHIYLVRLGEREGPGFDVFIKLLVVAYEPGISVTLRWQSIESP